MFYKILTLAGLALGAAFLAQAGPPLICHTYHIGSAKSLPWGEGSDNWDNPDPRYDLKRLKSDTLVLLNSGTPLIVRMETLRRATIYGANDHAAAGELLAALRQRADSKPDALADFDYGYFLVSLKQMHFRYKDEPGAGVDGYEYVRRALERQSSPELELACAFVAITR